MRIIYFLPDFEAGVSRVVRNLIKYKPYNSQVEYVVVVFHNTAEKNGNRIIDKFDNAQTYHFSFSAKENVYAVYKRLSCYIKSADDILVCNDGWEIRMVTALKLNNPVIYVLHGDFDYYYRVVKLNQSIINCYIAISNKIQTELQGLLKNVNTEIVKMYFPVAVKKYQRENALSSSGSFKILFAGSLEERKGAEILFAIYEKLLANKVNNFSMEIIGDGTLHPLLQDQFRGKANVILSGWKNNVYVIDRMKEATVFLFPSKAEGLPNVLIEALSAGAVPVASDLESGVRDIITENTNGLLINNPTDAAAFAEKITFLYNDKNALQQLHKNSLLGIEKFDPILQAAKYENKFLEIGTTVKNTIRLFPEKYNMGGILNKSWMPNWIVKLIRVLFPHPKL